MSGGFFRGTSADQDTRFSNKQAKLMKSQKFPPELEHLVDMTKVKMDVLRPWIATRVTELLGFEDEVLINFIYGLLDGKEVNGKEVQISLTGFMEKNTGKFMKELWTLLLSAQKNASGVPQQFLDAKEEETRKKKAETDRVANEIQKQKEKQSGELEKERMKKMDDEVEMKAAKAALEPFSKSSVHPEEEKVVDKRNGVRGRTRVSLSGSRSPSSARGSPSRSISKSISNSRSHSENKSRSLSRSPRARGRSHSSGRVYRSPRRRTLSPRFRHSSRVSLSPPRQRSSYSRRRSRSPSDDRSPTSVRRSQRSPFRRRSPSSLRRRSPSPIRLRSPSPVRRHRSPSPVRRHRSPSPLRRRRSPSPLRRRRSRSPLRRRRSRSPLRRRRSPTPTRHRSPPPQRRRSPPPQQRRSPSPRPHITVSPVWRRSPLGHRLPLGHRSRLAMRGRSQSPMQSRSPSPIQRRSSSPSLMQQPSSSPTQRRHGRSLSTPPHMSSSPARNRSPVVRGKKSPATWGHRSSPHQSRSSPSRYRSLSPVGRKSPNSCRKSPELSSRRKIQAKEKFPLMARQPSSSLGSPVRNLHNKELALITSSEKSPVPSRSPTHLRKRSSEEDRSPYKSPVKQKSGRISLDGRLSPSRKLREQKFRNSSSETGKEEITSFARGNGDRKSKSSQSRSVHLSTVSKQTDSPIKVQYKEKYSSERISGRHANESQNHPGHIKSRKKEEEGKSERSSGKGVPAESPARHRPQTLYKDAMPDDRQQASYPGDSQIDDRNHSRPRNFKESDQSSRLENVGKIDNDRGGTFDSGPEENDKLKIDKKRRKHRKSRKHDVSDDDYSSDSEIEERKEAKRRRKEEKRLRKEEKRQRREERRRRREERRAEKLKLNYQHNADASDGEGVPRKESHSSDNEEKGSVEERLEIELRKKALESLKAKKGISR